MIMSCDHLVSAQAVVQVGRGNAAAEALSTRIEGQVEKQIGAEAVALATVPETLVAVMRKLGDGSFLVRCKAAEELATGSWSCASMLKALDEQSWDLETRERVFLIVGDRILAAPRGALGVQMQPSAVGNRPGVTIADLVPSMPAERVLRIGDRIETVDGVAVSTNEECIDAIQSHEPGESIHLRIGRPRRGPSGRLLVDDQGGSIEEILEVDIPLASDADLDRASVRRPELRRASPSRSAERERFVFDVLCARRQARGESLNPIVTKTRDLGNQSPPKAP